MTTTTSLNPSIKKNVAARCLLSLAEQGKLPDAVLRFGIRQLCKQRLRNEFVDDPQKQQQRFQTMIEQLRQSPIAVETEAANEQHYEVPTDFYLACLGKRLKYSCAYYEHDSSTLDQAEDAMLKLYGQRAQLQNHQQILELGCGWGSLTLWMAENFPNAHITAVSNSSTQKAHIDQRCAAMGLSNVQVITEDVNHLQLNEAHYDRVFSIEMFEHMRNYRSLMHRISRWLKPDGKLFVHIFVHRYLMYPFEIQSDTDWMSKYFFTGGLMPSTDTLLHFQEHLKIEQRWLINGQHYQRTSNDWLANMDANRDEIMPKFVKAYGQQDAELWFHRWRLFYLAVAEFFGLNQGREWLVSHFLFTKPSLPASL